MRLPAALFAILLASPLFAAPASVPPGGTPLIGEPALDRLNLIGGNSTLLQSRMIDVQGQPFDKALRLTTLRRPDNRWDAQLQAPIAQAVKKGDAILIAFWARTVESRSETGEAQTELIFETRGQPYTKSLEHSIAVPRQWTQVMVPFTVIEDYAPGRASILFRLGFDPQTLEIGGLRIIHYGKAVALADLPRTRATYAGQEPDAPWRAAAAKRIDQHRKADLVVRIVDSAGRPVEGAQVQVRMQRHAFAFGSEINARFLLGESPDAQKYRAIVQKHFTRIVFGNDLKWPFWNRRDVPPALDWLEKNGIEARGHCLVWPSWQHTPRDLQALKGDPAALRKRAADHVTEIVAAHRGRLVDWDVINEVYTNHDLVDILGREAMVEWFKLARAADPKVNLYINDYSILSSGGVDSAHQEAYEQVIRYLKEQGAPVQGIGLQSHFGGRATTPERLLQVLDRFAALGLRIQITEFDIDSQDEQFQADFLRDFMTAVYSHPAVDGIIMWGFWEGRHWKPSAALWRRDWSLRPHGQAWLDLVTRDWWTNADATSDAKGECRVRGFLGDYEITVKAAGKTQVVKEKLPKGGQALRVELR